MKNMLIIKNTKTDYFIKCDLLYVRLMAGTKWFCFRWFWGLALEKWGGKGKREKKMLGHLYCGLRKGGVLKIYIKISIILLLAVLILSLYLWIGTQNMKTYQGSNIWYERIYERIQRGKKCSVGYFTHNFL